MRASAANTPMRARCGEPGGPFSVLAASTPPGASAATQSPRNAAAWRQNRHFQSFGHALPRRLTRHKMLPGGGRA